MEKFEAIPVAGSNAEATKVFRDAVCSHTEQWPMLGTLWGKHAALKRAACMRGYFMGSLTGDGEVCEEFQVIFTA